MSDDLQFEAPGDTPLVVAEGPATLTIPEEDVDTFLVPSEDNVFVVKRWS